MRRKLVFTLVAVIVVSYGAFLVTLLTGTHPALGLDLQGGVQVTQQPRPGTKWSSASLDVAVDKIRERVDSLGVAEPEILRQGDTVVVNLPGVRNQEQAIKLVQVTGQVYLRPVMQCLTAPDPNAPTTTTTIDPNAPTTTGPATTGVSTTTAETTTTAPGGPSRPVSSGNTTTTDAGATTTSAPSAVATTVAGATTTSDAGPTTTIDVPLDSHGYPRQDSDPTKTQYLPLHGAGIVYCQVGASMGTGEVFSDNATAAIINNAGWGVTVDLRSGSARAGWDQAVTACYNKQATCPTGQLAIELDGEIQSAPTINEPAFNSGVQISGSFTEGEAKDLARVLNSGSLPVTLDVLSVQNLSPTLGQDSLRAAWISGLVGVLLVLVFMVLYYRHLGLIAAAGLTVSGAILWSIIAWLSKAQGLALSLSGIAGVIVSVGVTVDSYVVFFERLKDEVRSGKSLRNSTQRGFHDAWRTIVVADLVSLIGALVLWYLTVGAVRGFAFFLGLSTLCDLFVAYYFTRPVMLLLSRTKWMEKRRVMGIEVASEGGVA